jgi:hypothetical protein
MNDLDELIRGTLRAHAVNAPTELTLGDVTQPDRDARWSRRRTLLAVAGVVAATAAAIVIPLSLTGSPGQRTPASSVGPAPSPAPRAPAGEMLVGFHGVELAVPSTWKINDTKCGTPVANTVIRDEGDTPACLRLGPVHFSSVELLDNTAASRPDLLGAHAVTNDNGVDYELGRLAGQPGAAVIVPSVGVVVLIDTTTSAETRRVLASLTTPATDVTGCPMRQHTLSPPSDYTPPSGAELNTHMIPADPTSITVCHYSDFWLESSTTTTGADQTSLIALANAARTGFVYAPVSTYSVDSCSDEVGTGYTLSARYSDKPTVMLWAHIGFCGPLGITNGVRNGALSEALAQAITAPLRTGFAMAGRLVSHPGTR